MVLSIFETISFGRNRFRLGVVFQITIRKSFQSHRIMSATYTTEKILQKMRINSRKKQKNDIFETYFS